jgi:hypothetical protein
MAVKKPPKQLLQNGLYEGRSDPRRAFFPGADFTWADLDWSIKRLNKSARIEFDGYKFQMEE